MKVMITGHRPDKLGGYDENNPVAKRIKTELSMQLELLLLEDPKIEIITGLAQGVDTWFAEIGIEKNIPIHAYIPFTGQESMWPEKAQERYREILAKYDPIHLHIYTIILYITNVKRCTRGEGSFPPTTKVVGLHDPLHSHLS